MRYQVALDQDSGRWVITNANGDLIWHGSHWACADRHGSHLITFPSYEAAEKYARINLGANDE